MRTGVSLSPASLPADKQEGKLLSVGVVAYLTSVCLTCAGYGHHVLQKILPEQLHYGVPPEDYHVSTDMFLGIMIECVPTV